MSRKIAPFAVLAAGISLAAVAVAAPANNSWYAAHHVAGMFVIDSNVGAVCQFTLDDNSNWAFKVSSHEKVVDLLQVALLNDKIVYVNFGGADSSSAPRPGDFLTFTPLYSSSTQKHPLAYGVSLAK